VFCTRVGSLPTSFLLLKNVSDVMYNDTCSSIKSGENVGNYSAPPSSELWKLAGDAGGV
jgi:hypothetical protein